jgi:hypothetical protein
VSISPTTIRNDADALVERLDLDNELLFSLLTAESISKEVQVAGFLIDDDFALRVEGTIQKMRAYISDQLHVLAYKRTLKSARKPYESGNGPYWD